MVLVTPVTIWSIYVAKVSSKRGSGVEGRGLARLRLDWDACRITHALGHGCLVLHCRAGVGVDVAQKFVGYTCGNIKVRSYHLLSRNVIEGVVPQV